MRKQFHQFELRILFLLFHELIFTFPSPIELHSNVSLKIWFEIPLLITVSHMSLTKI